MAAEPRFEWGSRTYVMGILNMSPDSFSGDGLSDDLPTALRQAKQMADEGADLIDVGGESTRPGHEEISLEEELRRVIPVVSEVARRVDLPISIDTTRSEVARQALAAGATIVNDIWATRRDPAVATVAAEAGAWLVLMHNRSARPAVDGLGGHFVDVQYDDLLHDVGAWLTEAVQDCERAGVPRNRMIVDPGLGFGKTFPQNLELIRRLGELRPLELPVLIGVSRKSFTGRVADLPVEQRLETSLAAMTLCIAGGADIVRVHDVGPSVRAARMADAVLRPAAVKA